MFGLHLIVEAVRQLRETDARVALVHGNGGVPVLAGDRAARR